MKKGFTDKCNCYDLGLVYVPSHRPAAHKIAALCDGVKIHGYRPAFANYNSKGEIERLQLTKIPSEQGRKRAAVIPPDIVEEMHSHWCSLVLNENEYSKAKSCKKQNLVIKQANGRFWNKQKKYGRYYQNGSEEDYWRMALRLGKEFVAMDGKHSLVKFFEQYNFVPGRQLHSCVKFVEDLEKFVGVRVHCNFNKAKNYRYMDEFHILFDLKGNMMDFILVSQHLKYKPADKFCLENLALRAKDPEFPNVIERPVEWTAAGSEQEDPLKRDGETVKKPEEQLCSDWMAGNCKRNVCTFLHSKAQAPHGRETWKNPAHITRPEDAHKRQQSRSDVDTVKEPCHAQTSEQKDPPERKGGTVQMFKNLCRDWAKGKCSRKVCRFSHSKPLACSLWAEAGSCSRKGNCRFLHSIDEDCSDWMAGNCKRNVCMFLHSKAQAPHGRETWKNPVHITRPEDAHKRQQSRSDVNTVKEPCHAQTGEQKDPPERKGGTVKKPEIQLHSEERSIVERTGAKKRKRKRTCSVDDEK